ncbi:MAG: FAD-dependent monooxygenase, partial [bacterium]|nr:FAD-dependent monooxygenase [bacterium]
MKVLIVGAGIGGLTLAGFLKDSEIDFEIVEKRTDWNSQGFSLGLWNNGRNILKKLGLEEKFDKAGSRIREYRVCDGRGKVLRVYNLSTFYGEYGLAYTHVDRTALHEWLFELVPKEKVRLGVAIQAINQKTNGVEVVFTTGEMKVYDLVVGSDGIHSKVRELAFGTNFESFDNWRVWYAWID